MQPIAKLAIKTDSDGNVYQSGFFIELRNKPENAADNEYPNQTWREYFTSEHTLEGFVDEMKVAFQDFEIVMIQPIEVKCWD